MVCCNLGYGLQGKHIIFIPGFGNAGKNCLTKHKQNKISFFARYSFEREIMKDFKYLSIFLILCFFVSFSYAEQSFVEDIFILSDIDKGEIEIRMFVQEKSIPDLTDAKIDLSIEYPDHSVKETKEIPFPLKETKGYFPVNLKIDPVMPWRPKTPYLYSLQMTILSDKGESLQTIEQRFGMRKLETKNAKFYVNNKPFYVRAYGGEGGCGCDELSPKQVRKRLSQARKFGFNTVRHHTHIPKPQYMEIADEVGIFVQMEIGGKKIGNDPESENFLQWKQKWIDMIQMGRKHPSSFIYSVGNEIYLNDPKLIESLNILYDQAKLLDPATFVLNRSGSNPFNDDYGKFDLIERPIGEYEHVAEFAREAFMLYLRGDRKGRSDEFPIIAHEYPLVASYPNTELTHKYKEEPEWIKTTLENARKNGLEHLLPLYVKNTEKIQNLCRKEMLEEARKFPELDGYSMLRFVDCGNYVSGVVDDFADPKSVPMEEFLRTNGETVLLCTWKKRSYCFGDVLNATLEISHHGDQPFSAPKCQWFLMNGPRVIQKGEFDNIRVGAVDVSLVGKISVKIPELFRASKLTLRAVLPGSRPLINNEWYFWAFPGEKAEPDLQKNVLVWDPRKRLNVYKTLYPSFDYIDTQDWKPSINEKKTILTDSWNEAFYNFLDKGGEIFLISDKSWHWPEEIGIFGLHITRIDPLRSAPPVFPQMDEKLTNWLTICSNNPKRFGNSGTIVYPHPSLKNFPHEGFCDLHFWHMIYRAKSFRLEDFPPGTVPIIRTIDNYYRGKSKGYMAELGVGEGKIFLCTLNLTQSLERDVATQFMFDQLLQFTGSQKFKPDVKMTSDELKIMLDKYAKEIEENPLPVLSEMPARYETIWKTRLFSRELIVLYPYEAEGIREQNLGVHYDYARTLWFYNALPGDQLSWEFSNKKKDDFEVTAYLAGTARNVPLEFRIDDKEPQKLIFPGSEKSQEFIEMKFRIESLDPGKHTFILAVPKDAPRERDYSVQVREIELRIKDKSREE